MDKLASANSQFAPDLFEKLKEVHPTGNIFFSPLSLLSALAMVTLGACGNTASELLKTLHFDGIEDLHSVFHMLNAKINQSNEPCSLKLANRLYGEKTYNFMSVSCVFQPKHGYHDSELENFNTDYVSLSEKDFYSMNYEGKECQTGTGRDYLTRIKNLYGAELSTVDFSNAPDKAKKEINQWVEKQTEGKIPELLSEGSISQMTKLILVNAVGFKGTWAKAFNEKNTKDKPFRLNKTEKKNVKMFMEQELPFGFIPENNSVVFELSFRDKEFSLIAFYPDSLEDNSTGLEELEKQLTLEKLQEWTQPKNMNFAVRGKIHLPKFKMQENYDLKSYLVALGLVDVFDSGKADLSGMSGAQDLHVSKIVHKSFLEVNEEGIEAAATTAATHEDYSSPMEEDFNADHPFLFLIRHNPTNTILFLGRFASP